MKIHLATDHAGFELKNKILQYLIDSAKPEISSKISGRTNPKGFSDYEVSDHGAFEYDENDDYPNFVSKAAQAVSEDPENNLAIVLGGSGQGEDMVADKFPHVRSAVYYGGNLEIVKLARSHNNANVLSLGARFLSEDEAILAVKIFIETPFSDEERHKRRIEEIEELDV